MTALDVVPARALPRRRLVRLLKRCGVRQRDIARSARVSVGYVNQVIARTAPRTRRTERIWRAIERAIAA